MTLTLPQALADEHRWEAARKEAHDAERLRQQRTGMGVWMSPYQARSEAEMEARARKRIAAHDAPDAVLQRRLIIASNAGSLDAERIYQASCRGDANWQTDALALLGPKRRAAA